MPPALEAMQIFPWMMFSDRQAPALHEAREHREKALPIKQSQFTVGGVVQKDDFAAEITASLDLLDEILDQPAAAARKHQLRNVLSASLHHHLPDVEQEARIFRTSMVPTQSTNSEFAISEMKFEMSAVASAIPRAWPNGTTVTGNARPRASRCLVSEALLYCDVVRMKFA